MAVWWIIILFLITYSAMQRRILIHRRASLTLHQQTQHGNGGGVVESSRSFLLEGYTSENNGSATPSTDQYGNGAGDIEQGIIHQRSAAGQSATPGADEVQAHQLDTRMRAPPSTTSRERGWSRTQLKAAEMFAYMIFTVSGGALYGILSACISADKGSIHILLHLCVSLLVVAILGSAIIVLLIKIGLRRHRCFGTILKVVICVTSATELLSVILSCFLLQNSKI